MRPTLALSSQPSPTTTPIRISTLGGLSVRGDGDKPIAGAAAQPRRMAILALLARAGERGMNREKLLALLWPDADVERGPRALAQALYALRKDLGAEDAIAGARELRLDPGIVTTDVAEFSSAVARGDDERAVALYAGPFLDGFHVPGAGDFTRWAESERAALSQDYSRALESLARGAQARGDPLTAVSWWRKLAGLEPLNARVTVGLMEALTASGDRAGAIKQARVYEVLVEQELDLPPDKDVMALADRLRAGAGEATVAQLVSPNVTREPAELHPASREPHPASREPHPASRSPHPASRRIALVATVGAIAAIALFLARDRAPAAGRSRTAGDGLPIVAIGHIAAFGGDSAHANLAAPVADLLATSLARSRGIRVVSQGRMRELMRLAGTRDSGAGAFVDAARRAGAAEVIDGTLYGRPGGGLRLDLRRVHLATGAIDDVQSVEGNDLFALVDSGTARLVTALGTDAPVGSVTEVTTRSLAAYRLYEQGVRAFYRGEYRAALGFCDNALAEDSLFALAAYYGALASSLVPGEHWPARMERAKELAARAGDRERLTIMTDWAYRTSAPAFRVLADSLAARYPAEVEGHLYSGIARVFDGEFLAALGPLERVIAMDSGGVSGARAMCAACQAFEWRVAAYRLADSLAAAERSARAWLRAQPRSWDAATKLIEILEFEGRATEAESTAQLLAPPDHPYDEMVLFEAVHRLRAGDYGGADSLLEGQIRRGGGNRQADALWYRAIGLRERGRLAEAVAVARRLRLFADPALPRHLPQGMSVLEAQLQLEAGRGAVAALLFDSIAHVIPPASAPSQIARQGAWMLTHAASARLVAGDTANLARLADSIRALGVASAFARDQRLHHYVRGLLLAARGRDDDAATEFRAAIYSTTGGYTRTNLELGRALLRLGRAREAVAVLQPAFRGPLDVSNLYVSRTELHELLAQAWEAAGGRDSAAAHYEIVARAWSEGDPPFRSRAAAARLRGR